MRTLEDARVYLRKGALDMYERVGFGMFLVILKSSGEPIGTCGLIKRESLDDVDIGFAFLPKFRGHGFAIESAAAVLEYGWGALEVGEDWTVTQYDAVSVWGHKMVGTSPPGALEEAL